MEHRLKRPAIAVVTDENGKVDEKEYNKYKQQTRAEYEDLMMEFEFRCRRAATMHYYEASGYDKNVYRMELLAALLGTISVSSIAAWFLQGEASSSLSSFSGLSKLGGLGVVTLAGAALLQMVGRGSTRLIPSISHRAEIYVAAGAAWQRLAQKTRSYRIRLDDPTMDVPAYATWYEELITEREQLCVMATIPQATYELYNNPERVYRQMKLRRQMFLQFLQLEDSSVDDIVGTSTVKSAGSKSKRF